MPQTSNRAAVTQIEVVFKEIDALYDLPGPGTHLVGDPRKPRVAIDLRPHDRLLGERYRMGPFVDDLGEPIEGNPADMPGMYGGVRVSGYAPFWRGFSRKRAAPVDQKYVYVFSADAADGSGLALEHELFFDKGELAFVDHVAHAGKDVRPPGKRKSRSVWLEVVRIKDGKPALASHFAWLAPFQIPWQRLQAIVGDKRTPARAQRIGDPFVTDGFIDGDPSSARTFHELFKGNKPGMLGHLVYLVDPFKEALRRVEAYHQALDAWLERQLALARDDSEYVLAKRVELFSTAYKLQALVADKLVPYLGDKEQALAKLRFAAETSGESVMRWVAYDHRHDHVEGADLCYRDGRGKAYPIRVTQQASVERVNPFSEAARDYREADDATLQRLQPIVQAVHSRMGECGAGVTWMAETLDDFVAKKFPVSSAGAEMLFESARKGAGGGAELWAPFFKYWAQIWVRNRKTAAKDIKSWVKATHGVDVETLSRDDFKREWRTMKDARKNAEAQWLDTPTAKARNLGIKGLEHVMFGFEIVNLALSVAKLANNGDGWSTLGLLGSIGDFYGAAAKLSARLEQRTFTYGGVTRPLRVAPLIALASSVIDFVLFGKDALTAKTMGDRVAHSTRTLGAALTVISSGASVLSMTGTITSGVGWGVLVLGAGLLLQAVGSFVASNFTPASVFLRHCTWGSGGGGIPRSLDRPTDEGFFGYRGPLDALGRDLNAQHEILNEMMYDYTPTLELGFDDAGARVLVLKMGTPDEEESPRNPRSRWMIELTIDHKDGTPPAAWSWHPDANLDHQGVSANREIVIKGLTTAPPGGVWTTADRTIEVRGVAKLDPFGTGTYLVEREIKESFAIKATGGSRWQSR